MIDALLLPAVSHFGLMVVAVLAPLAAAAVLMAVAPLRRSGMPAALVTVLATGLSFAASCLLLMRRLRADIDYSMEWSWLPEAGQSMATVGLMRDGISVPMLAVVSGVALMVQVFSLDYMSSETKADFGRYFTWHALFLFSMMGLVASPNLLQLFAFWELVGLCSYLLIGFYWKRPSAARAALKAFWMTKFADMGLLLGLILMYVGAGSFGWDMPTVIALHRAELLAPVCLLLFVAVMGKSAQFPLHIWLPDAMEGPTPVSALLHAATMVAAGVYLVVRAWPLYAATMDFADFVPVGDLLAGLMLVLGLSGIVLSVVRRHMAWRVAGVLALGLAAIAITWRTPFLTREVTLTTQLVMALVGGTTAFLAACMAMVQTDIKKVLAYSTCSQLGYMVAALGAGAMGAAYFHLTTHAFFKALLFLGAGSVIHAVHSNQMKDMGGLWRRMPITTVTFIVGSLALAGLPFFSGFYSKDLVLEELLASTGYEPLYWVPFLATLAAAPMTAFYMGRVVWLTFFGAPSPAARRANEGSPFSYMPLVLLAIPAVLAGYAGPQLFELYGYTYELHVLPPMPQLHDGHLSHWVPMAATVLALGALVLSYLVYNRRMADGLLRRAEPLVAFIQWGAVDRAWLWGYRSGVLVFSSGLAWFDRYVVDGLINAAGAATLRVAEGVRVAQTGRVADYVWVVVVGAIALVMWGQIAAGVSW